MGGKLPLASALGGPSDGFSVAIERVDCRLSNAENLITVVAAHEEEVANIDSRVAIGLSFQEGRVHRLLDVDASVVRPCLITMRDVGIEQFLDSEVGLTMHLKPEGSPRGKNGQV